MKRSSRLLRALAAIAALALPMGAEAGDSGPANSAQVPLKLDQQIDQAVGASGGSSSDVESRIKDLESTRAEIDQKRPPTVSLSVSGFVNQEVQYNVK